jgi:Family of unknown function (DUF6159)
MTRGWELTKTSWGLLRSDAQLARFTVMSAVLTLVASVLFVVPAIAVAGSGSPSGPAGVVLLFVFYVVTTCITVYYHTALVAVAMDRPRGGNASMSLGYEVARRNLRTIVLFALLSATVGIALWFGIAIAAVYLALLFVVASAMGQIFRAAIYLYAETGVVPAAFDAALVRGAFKSA